MAKAKIAVLVSGGGTNLQALIDAQARGEIVGGEIAAVRDYTVPQTDVRHRAVIIEKVRATPRQFPRSFARIKKAPLR